MQVVQQGLEQPERQFSRVPCVTYAGLDLGQHYDVFYMHSVEYERGSLLLGL